MTDKKETKQRKKMISENDKWYEGKDTGDKCNDVEAGP